jgi:hypothetical protein
MDAAGRRHIPVAVVVSASLHRSVFNVFRWLAGKRGGGFRAFPPEALGDALAWLGVNAPREEVANAIARLQSTVARRMGTARAR